MTSPAAHRVSYYYDSDVGNFYYAQGHPMKPYRVRMTHNLLLSYGMLDRMDVLVRLVIFWSVDFLGIVTLVLLFLVRCFPEFYAIVV